MVEIVKIPINWAIICLFITAKSFCSSPNFEFVNNTLQISDVDDRKAFDIHYLKSPRLMRHIPTAIRKRSLYNKAMVKKSIRFMYYKDDKLLFETTPGMDSQKITSYIIAACGNRRTSFIFHGWTENCSTDWVTKLMERLTFYRGGCIVCIDYGVWSKKPYLDLVQKFEVITQILYEEILMLINNGLDPKRGYMFGFSYGGQLASEIGRRLNREDRFKRIDICDIAGPGFDFLSFAKHHEAADNVQCYYSSIDKGSQFRSCHQNILLGHCGYSQPAILSQPYFSSHGLCVQIYLNAFDFPFYAVRNTPSWCLSGNPVKNLPLGFTVGYNGGRNMSRYVTGDILVPTGLNYPYNLSKRELILYEKYINKH